MGTPDEDIAALTARVEQLELQLAETHQKLSRLRISAEEVDRAIADVLADLLESHEGVLAHLEIPEGPVVMADVHYMRDDWLLDVLSRLATSRI